MGAKDPRIDAYIEKAEPFARPVLKKVRALFHKGCPKLEETMKWGAPSFDYQGMLGGMASFKQHVSYGFWKAKLMDDPQGILKSATGQSNFSFKASSIADLPDEMVLVAYVKEAKRLNDAGVNAPAKKRKPRKAIEIPDYFQKALNRNKKAKSTFDGFPYSKRRDYVEWLTEAKREATREKRLATAIEWLADGKSRNWKYENC